MFGSVKLTKNADLDKYGCSGYGIGFNHIHTFHCEIEAGEKNVIIFEVDNSSSVHVDSKKKKVLVLSEGPMQRLDDTTITTEAKYSINFTESGEIFVLSLHYYLLMLQIYIKSKQKTLK